MKINIPWGAEIPDTVMWWKDITVWFNFFMVIAVLCFWCFFQQSRWAEIAAIAQGVINIILRILTTQPRVTSDHQLVLNEAEIDARERHSDRIKQFIARGRKDND